MTGIFTPEFFDLDALIAAALREDIGAGDITTLSCVPEGALSRGLFRAKEDGVVCGLFILPRVFAALSPDVAVAPLVREGAEVKNNELIAEIEGPSRAVLTGERVALNLVQRLSGIATRTAAAARVVRGTRAKIADTRKTTPGLRALEKYAVRAGGGHNHRFGLDGGILIKDNHIKAAGGIARAVKSARAAAPHTLKIEVETETLPQVLEAIDAGADIIMLDNMGVEAMSEAVRLVAGRALTEASGNMGDRDLRKVAETGVDIISIGGLTHSAKALDISLKF
ncbi:MAG: carboxylating nicotinate-nucleotide diphosphorylase [Oscillospiraceae bacterium]|jgi:nicotinate-nucleotide pyrophosphorylase (carboxylating)|nr:carboxylating nicotinate-nucleotide diphosphorylase [Oscillospiraceae bacterium]